jgi:hypothetical protein
MPLQKPRITTVDEFIARMVPLLDMERDAEVAQVHLAFLCASSDFSASLPITKLDIVRNADGSLFAAYFFANIDRCSLHT